MTTTYQLVPSLSAPPQFMPTFDGQQYLVTVTWNLFGQRYYVNCSTLNGVVVFSVPLLESPAAADLADLTWDVASQLVTATTRLPHGYPLASGLNLTVSGCLPVAFNGAFSVFVTSPNTFTYPLQNDPGGLIVPGSAGYLISMTAGYFNSVLLYYNGSFVVAP